MRARPALAARIGAALAFALIARAAGAAEILAPDTTSFTLANGLTVVVVEDHRAPVVHHMVWYKVGSADEQPGKSGIAHFLEHLMFKGTKDHPEGEFSERISDIGGSENAFTAADYTGYHQTVARQHLAFVMEFEADRMQNLVLSDEDIIPERDVILEERRSRVDNDPASQLGEAVSAAMFQNHHYGIPVIGWEHEMQTLDLADALAFYDRYYTPNNAIVVIGGDVTPEEVRPLAEATYGMVARRAEPPERVRPIEPEPLAPRTVELTDATVSQSSWRREYLVPSYLTAEGREALALDILADILGNGPTSRLYRDLVVDKKIATSAGTWYNGLVMDEATLGVYAVPSGDVTLDALAVEIDKSLSSVLDDGVTQDQLERAKHRMIASTIYQQDSVTSLARMFGASLAIGETIENVQNWPSLLEEVTLDDVNAVAKKYLTPTRSVTGRLLGTGPGARS